MIIYAQCVLTTVRKKSKIMKNMTEKENIMKLTTKEKTLRIAELAMLVALIVVLQFTGATIPIGLVPLTFVLIPIVVGAFLLGPIDGAILGFVFGLITVIQTPQNLILMFFFNAHPVLYVVLALLKATAAGFFAGLIYKGLGKAFKGKYKYLQTLIASISAPIINTGIFAAGMLIFFYPELGALPTEFAKFFGTYINPLQVLFLGLIGFNFVGEFIVSLVLSPAIVRIIEVVKKKLSKE